MNETNGANETLVPPPPRIDAESSQLRLLAVAHFTVAGIDALFAILSVLYVLLAVVGLMAEFGESSGDSTEIPAVIAFLVLGSAFGLFSAVFAACLVYAGLCIQQVRSWKFCFTMAVLACASLMFCACGVPNLILGIVSLVMLLRPTVKTRFGVAQ